MRVLTLLLGLLLLPVTAATGLVLRDLVWAMHTVDGAFSLSLLGGSLLGGFLFWLFFWFVMPRPVRTYVLAHELSHALWGLAMGARVSKVKVGKKGGSVHLSKTNALITLAPYFFPFYTLLVVLLYGILLLFFDLAPYLPFWLSLIGFTWGFHLTFTLSSLGSHQPDIQAYGQVFSYTLITWLNLLGLCLWVIAVAPPQLEDLESGLTGYLTGWGSWITAHTIRALPAAPP